MIHDSAIVGNHIVIGIDRAGIVGEDGELIREFSTFQ